MTQEYMTIAQATKLKGCARLTIYNWIRDGKINTIEIAGKKFVVRDKKFETAKTEKRSDHLAERITALEVKMEQLSQEIAKGKV